MSASNYTPSEQWPTYDDYRRAKQREYKAAWKRRNKAAVNAYERERVRAKRASDEAFAQKLRDDAKARYGKAPTKAKSRSATVRAKNKDACVTYCKKYYSENKSVIQAYKKDWVSRNRHSVNSRNAARRALCAKATPAWADKQAINDVYAEARYMQMHVDHIVPLNHPQVCGLHVWDNLQLLTKEANLRKNNRFDPETYHAD